ncbi:MAG TPA: PAS domain-containing protein [Actinomycetota bacterium]
MWPLSEDRFKDLLDGLPGVFYADSHEATPRTLYLSPNADSILGAGAEEHLRDPDLWYGSIHPDDLDGLMASWRTAFETEQPYVTDYRYQRPDGSTIWLREHAAPIRDDEGTIQHWQGMLLDVSREHEILDDLRASETRYRMLAEGLPAVVYQDTDESPSRSVYVSPNAADVLGADPDANIAAGPDWIRSIHPDDRERFSAAWDRARESGSLFALDFRWCRPDGSVIWVHDHSWPIDVGGTRMWQGVLLDITAQKEAEARLTASETRYRALVEHVPAVVYEMGDDDERRALFVSPQIEALLGYSRDEWLTQPDIWAELLHPDDREEELDAHDHHSATGEPWSREYRLIATDGREIWVRDQARLVLDAAGAPTVWRGVLIDITAQKEAEVQLRAARDELKLRVLERTHELEVTNELMSLEIAERRRVEQHLRDAEERARILIEEIPAAAYRWQVRAKTPDDWSEMYVSPAIERLLGFSVDEWNTSDGLWKERVHPHDRQRVLAAARQSARTGEPYEVEARYLAKDGRVVWVLDRATLLRRDGAGDPYVFQGVMVDVTDRKRAERQAGEAEERLRSIVEEGPDVTYAFGVRAGDPPTLTIEYVSPQVAAILGYDEMFWLDEPARWMDMVHPDDAERVAAAAATSWTGGSSWDNEYRMLRADGSIVWIHDRGRCVLRDDEGRPVRFLGAISEVSERVESATTTARERDAYRTLLDETPAIVWSEEIGRDGQPRYTFMSPHVHTITGYTAAELMAEPYHFPRMVHPDDRARVVAASEASDDDEAGIWEDEYRILHRDGTLRWLWSRSRRVTPLGQYPAVWHGVTLDVTARHADDNVRDDRSAERA